MAWEGFVRARLFGPLALLLAAGCGDSTDPPDGNPCESDVVTLTVESPQSDAPRFRWTPECPMAFLQVSSSAGIAWAIDGNLLNVISPGVAYGDTPFATDVLAGPTALQAGTSYEVLVNKAIPGPGGTTLGGGGSVVFVR
jgi:hypothetical protein